MSPRRQPLLWLFLAALALRALLIVLEPPARRVGDEGMWKAMGVELASPQVGFSPLRSRLISHPPLYPYLLAISWTLGGSAAIKWAQALLGALLVPALGRLGTAVYGRRTGLLAAAFAAVDPVLVWQTAHFWSEILFLALLWWGVERLVAADREQKAGAAVAAGLLLGLATLARETVFYFAPLVAFWLAWRRPRGLVRAALFLLAGALVVSPWAWRNQRLFGSALPIATRGTLNLWKGNAGRPWDEIHAEYARLGSEHERARRAGAEAWQAIRARQPQWLFEKTVREIPELWGVNNLVVIHLENGAYGPLSPATNRLVGAVTIVPYVSLLALAVFGLAAARAGRAEVLLIGFLLAYTALHVVVFGFPRFRLPLMPVVFLLAAEGFFVLRERRPLGPRRRVVAVALGLVLAAVLAQSLVQTLRHPIFGLG